MKFNLTACAMVIFLSSCLKQSIPDALLQQNSGGNSNVTATLSYEVNGNAVNLSVNDAANQDPNSYSLGCTKSLGEYFLDGLTNTGEFTFHFITDSLAVGNYKYTSIYGPQYFLSYNGSADYVYNGYDSLSFNITSYKNGLISGNFSGLLTPLIDPNNNTYGTTSSVIITNGSFKNVPIFY